MEEQWKDIEGYEGVYQISTNGRVKSLGRVIYRKDSNKVARFTKNKIRKLKTDKCGYKFINLSKNGISKNFLIHRLVASAFIPNPNKLPEVNHKDENKTNNNVSNLEWCDRQYNISYGTFLERSCVKETKQVYRCDKEWNILQIYNSIYEAIKEGYNATHISECCRCKRKTHGGFKWRYANK